MIRTFVDAGVLIAAATGRNPDVQPLAVAILDDANRVSLSSPFIQLEVLPKAVHGQRATEGDFYRTFFGAAIFPDDLSPIIAAALDIASQHGLNGMDALHLAAARAMQADEFVTTERPTRPIFRVTDLRITTIRPWGKPGR